MAFGPGPALFRHRNEEAKQQLDSVHGRTMYEVMRCWDDDQAQWGAEERAFAAAWRKQHKWLVSRTLKSVGSNAGFVGMNFISGLDAVLVWYCDKAIGTPDSCHSRGVSASRKRSGSGYIEEIPAISTAHR
jgi:hypothetical protein